MHHILAPARKPPVSALDLWVLFKNQAVSGNTNKKQNAERQEQTYKVAALGYLSEVCNVQRSSMNMWQYGIAGSFIDPRIQLGTGPVAEKLQHAEFRCSQERGLANPGLPMSFNICIDIPLSEKKSIPAGFFFFNNYSRLFLHVNKSLEKELARNISEWHLLAPVKTVLITSCQGS